MAMRLVGLALLFGTTAALAFDSTKVGQWGSLYRRSVAGPRQVGAIEARSHRGAGAEE